MTRSTSSSSASAVPMWSLSRWSVKNAKNGSAKAASISGSLWAIISVLNAKLALRPQEKCIYF